MQHSSVLVVICVVLAFLALTAEAGKNSVESREDCDEFGRPRHRKFSKFRDEGRRKQEHYKKGEKGHKEHPKKKQDDNKHKGGHHRQVTIVLGAVIGALVIVGIAVAIYKKCIIKRGTVAEVDSTPEKMKQYTTGVGCNEKNGPLPDVGIPAYVIAGAPPPVYSLVNDTTDYSQRPPSAPPTYSTIDLREAVGDVTVVQVRPLEEK